MPGQRQKHRNTPISRGSSECAAVATASGEACGGPPSPISASTSVAWGPG